MKLLTNILLFTFFNYNCFGFEEPSEKFAHELILADPDIYKLFWKYDDTYITFEIQVKTKGWVGFGISPNGGMTGSDIMLAWIKDGKPILEDRHAIGNLEPKYDESQDWKLLLGKETNQYTIFKFHRKLITCDDNDRIITGNSTMRLIWAYNYEKPTEKPSYHGTKNRGTKSVSLISTSKVVDVEDRLKDSFTWDIRTTNFSIPDDAHTYYNCEILKLPPLIDKHHVISATALLNEKYPEVIHHILIYSCHHDVDDRHVGITYKCYTNQTNMANHLDKCNTVIFGWAVGGEQVFYPENVGFPYGESDKPLYVRMEIHYDNPSGIKNIVDDSGMRIWLTKKLRKYDSGVMSTGHDVGPLQLIPPKVKSFTSYGHCAKECLEEGFEANNREEVKIIALLLHAHIKAIGLKVRHFRGDTELEPIAYDDSYDFNFQQFKFFPEEKTIKKGDRLTVECYYNTIRDNTTIVGGLSTRNEMCLAFLLYYPKMSLARCLSHPEKQQGIKYYQHAMTQGWTMDQKVQYQEFVGNSKIVQICQENKNFLPISGNTTEIEPVKRSYVPPNLCEIIPASPPSSSSTLYLSGYIIATLLIYYLYIVN